MIVGQDDADAQSHAGQPAPAGFALDGLDQSLGETEAARRGQDRETAEIEVALDFLDEHTAQHLGPALQHDGAGALRQLGRDVFRGLAEGAGFRHQLAAILSERGRDRGGDGRCVARGSGTQEESVAHVLFLA